MDYHHSDLFFSVIVTATYKLPLDETIDICIKNLFKTPDTLVNRISKNDFTKFTKFGYQVLHSSR